MSKEKKIKPDQLSNDSIQPLIDWCEENKGQGGSGPNARGGISQVMEQYTQLTGETPPRCQFQRWLHPKKTKRTQPGLGTGLVLLFIMVRLTGKTFRIEKDAITGEA